MPPRSTAAAAALATGLLALPALAPQASAAPADAPQPRTVQVPSFDGTKIVTNFFPAKGLAAGAKAPTVLVGHGWGGRGETDPAAGQVALFTGAGYNVLTWNARGFGSAGEANVDRPDVEGRDVIKLVDWTAAQPEALLDRAGDPRVAMAGGSYGGGIQLVAAGLDRRVDVIAPTIAFANVRRSLYRDEIYRAGWGALLCLGGVTSGNRIAPQVLQGCASGGLTGTLSPQIADWFDHAGAGDLVKKIKIPTLVMQGTVDTLFTLREGLTFYRPIKASGAPVKMIWFCGGHGTCTTKPGDANKLNDATLAWFARYLKKDASVQTGPGFEFIDQDGAYHAAATYPAPAAGTLAAAGAGHLDLGPLAPTSGIQTAAQPAAKAIEIPVKAPATAGMAAGVPHLKITYKGSALNDRTAVYAQLVDKATGVVLGNQATPLPVVLDGRTRTVERDIEAVSWKTGPSSRLVLQIIPSTGLFTGQKAIGWVDVARASLSVPRVKG
ncbi:alpha/beta hydrolase family protein [Actinomadura parmotrematis]|uniref:Prolyl oligopeptidase family serine peptidase n=1 Tax=Actinomadura parmotrematis TaxID=2864039 RepID=A0ABS7G1C1_9ACTN|nr:CocE/NonD family hydrolase [Actinomadura parmotrematis]MBW8486501.1 prolyl oligopeptidase family serine peptidase [Actinomadura parmotrematis]